ncbi:hypothetical protein Acr_00g0065950 [Actinidia rufa]|uniref:Uncharacterized protein n=1 Tax=Actinidia rufa TaxID=165716 RepID=A0A7J0DRT0_9ERIC|nr:hypothetical protein Acr_00g0065950 [Actinidia rufa]
MADEIPQIPPFEESSPLGRLPETRIPGKGEMVLSASASKNIISVLVIWRFYRRHLSLNEFRCLYALLKGPGSESGWLYFKARLGKNILNGAPSNVKGWKRRFFFVLGLEFHPSIPREEGAVRVPRLWGALRGETEGNIGGTTAASTGDASESSHSKDVSCPKVPSREDSIEFVGIIGKDMRTTLPHAGVSIGLWAVLRAQIGWYCLYLPNVYSVISDLTSIFLVVAMSKRIKLSELAKVVSEKAATSLSKGMVISEASKTTPKKRALDDGSKGKQVAPLPKAKKIKAGSVVHVAPTRPPVVPGEGSSARFIPSEALGPQTLVMASAATVEKILARVILPIDKEKVEKLIFDQVMTKFLHVLGQVFVFFLKVSSAVFPRRAIELEVALTEEKAKGKKFAEEVKAKNKEVARLEARVAELEKSQNLAKGRIHHGVQRVG